MRCLVNKHLDIICDLGYYNNNDRQRRVSVKALKYRGGLANLAIWSFREGLCSETPSQSRQKPKENAQNKEIGFYEPISFLYF